MSRTWQTCSIAVQDWLGAPFRDGGTQCLKSAGIAAKCASSCGGKSARESTAMTIGYGVAGRVASIVQAKGGNEIAHETYRYDQNCNRIEHDEGNGAFTGSTEQKTTYLYKSIG
jgi:hypothetical protein